jgi:hypothetical protein
MFELFRIWLVVAGVGISLAGAAISLLGGTRVFAPINRLFDPAFWPGAPDEATRRYQAWIYGVLGGTMAGWGVTVTVLVSQAYASREGWVWWAVAAGTALWYVLDTTQSVRYRVYANAVINTALLVALAIPLALTFTEFRW